MLTEVVASGHRLAGDVLVSIAAALSGFEKEERNGEEKEVRKTEEDGLEFWTDAGQGDRGTLCTASGSRN